MKFFLKFLVTQILSSRARRAVARHHAQVIAVTGSIGKTTAKQAIYTILKNRFNAYASPEGFNSELGMSLAILQEEASGFSSALKWFKILKRAFEPKKHYQKLILEMAADGPGDISRLIKIAPPAIAVVTAVAPVHLEKGQFKDIQQIAREKAELVAYLPREGVAILNADDPLVVSMKTPGQRFTYGTEPSADLWASDITITSQKICFMAHYKTQIVSVDVPVLGEFQVYALLPAIAVGITLGMSLEECAKALYQFILPPGRMNPIPGINRSHLIDSSYNASPASMGVALRLLKQLPASRRIAAIGTMNELGEFSQEFHLGLGRQAAEAADMLVAVGPEASTIKKGAEAAGMNERDIYTFFDSEEAGHFLQKELKPKDLVLIKGSQNRVRMERLTKLLMAHPEKANSLLCRQGDEWERI